MYLGGFGTNYLFLEMQKFSKTFFSKNKTTKENEKSFEIFKNILRFTMESFELINYEQQPCVELPLY